MLRNIASCLVALSLFAVTPACDSGPSAEEKAATEAAAAKKAAEKKEYEDGLAKRKADREAKEKAKEDAAAKLVADVDALCVLPEKMPKSLDTTCAAVATSTDAFMLRLYQGEAIERWTKAKGMQLKMATATCMKVGSLEAAACTVNALDNAPEELKKQMNDFVRRCGEKFPKAE